MINLIPSEGKSVTKLEYWARVTAVWSFLFLGVCIVATLLLLPSYVLLATQLQVLNSEVDKTQANAASFKEIEVQVEETNIVIDQLATKSPSIPASAIIDAVAGARNEGVQINRYIFALSEKGGKDSAHSIQIQGEARTREVLARFKTDLEKVPLFETASVPLSDLARETELPFVITITLATTDI